MGFCNLQNLVKISWAKKKQRRSANSPHASQITAAPLGRPVQMACGSLTYQLFHACLVQSSLFLLPYKHAMLPISVLTVALLVYPPLAAPCAPNLGNVTFAPNGLPSSSSSGAADGSAPSANTNTFATVTVDTTVPWSENGEDQQAASLPIDTQASRWRFSGLSINRIRNGRISNSFQLRNLQSIYVHGDPKVESIMESPSGNGTRIVSQIGWNGNESQLRVALEEAFKYNELMAKFDVAMVPKE
uniref:Uncharacterized protein n=1 Tax=Pristionchus pacificus TaxID=54126 RepID=A0A8R1YZD3_PRIPA